MNRRFQPRAIVFDLDGTLVDTAADIVAALDTLLLESGRSAVGEAAGRRMIGDGARVLVERGFSATGGPPANLNLAFERWISIYSAGLARQSVPYRGVVATLSELRGRGVKLAVCTNKADRLARLLLDKLDLSRHFQFVVGGDFPHRKPDPRHVVSALDALDVEPADALMVGDSPNDAKAARAAGMRLALVDYGYTDVPVTELGADAILNEFSTLLELVG